MEPATANAWIGGIAGLITGAIASLVAPWAKWGVEKERIKQRRRAELIDNWRLILSHADFDRTDILNDPSYGPLRVLLSDEARKSIQRPRNHITLSIDSPTNSPDRDILLREVARIEKSWGLI